MMFASGKEPAKVREAGLTKWYDGLAETDRVKLGRYLDYADASSKGAFLASVEMQAVEDHNYAFAALVGEHALAEPLTPAERFAANEGLVLAYFNLPDYDRCVAACDAGLALLRDPAFADPLRAKNRGQLPTVLHCRSYKLNVAVGVRYDYDEGDRILDQYLADGLIDAEELAYRKQSIKIFRLQKTFDGIYALKEKDQ